MDWPTAAIRIVQELKGILAGIVFVWMLHGIAAIVKSGRITVDLK